MWCKGLRACNAVRVRCLEVSCFALVFQSPHALWVLSVTFRLELFFCDGRSVKSKESIKWCDDKIWKLVVATQYTCNRVLPCACRHNGQAKPSVDSYRDSMRFEGFSNLVANRVTVWAHTHTQTQQPVQLHPPATPPNGTHRSTLMKPANAIWIEMDRNASWKVFSWHTKSEWSFIRVLGLLASVAGCVWCVMLLQCMLPGFYAGILLMCCSSKRAIFPSCKLARSCFLGISLSPMLAL